MKKFLFSLIALSFVVVSFASGTIVVPPSKKPAGIKASEMMIPLGKNGAKISIQDLSRMKLKDYQLITGKKMKLMDKISFKLMQKEIRHSINADGYFVNKKMDSLKFKNDTSKAHNYFRTWIILLIAAAVLLVLGLVVPFIGIIGLISLVGAAVFFVLWLVAVSGGM
ncbi:MAG: hypothetical protein ACJ75B_19535 [Flavisolibacter sp.]